METGLIQRQGRALGDPSRFKLFEYIANAGRPVNIAELTEFMGFNHNAVRQHLAVLTDASLVHEFTEHRTSRGRPRKLYEARTDALAAFSAPGGPYERLARLLLDMHQRGTSPYETGYRDGTATDLTNDRDSPTADALHRRLALGGFEPEQTGDSTTLLQNCPFADLAAENPDVVCELHHGLIDGYLAVLEPGVRATLDAKPAHSAGCVIAVDRSE